MVSCLVRRCASRLVFDVNGGDALIALAQDFGTALLPE